jgi:hypothetical protein
MISPSDAEVKVFLRVIYAIIGTGTKGKHADILSTILQNSTRPPLFEPGEPLFRDDPPISKGMLEVVAEKQ